MREKTFSIILLCMILLLMTIISGLPPSCTLVNITPSNIEANSTGLFEAIINCTDDDGINASRFLITKTVDGFTHPGIPNYWSIRPPVHDEAVNHSEHNIPKILKADGRWDNKWYDTYEIGGVPLFSDNFTYAVNDNSSMRVTITAGTGWALLNYTWKVEPTVFRSSLPLSRGKLEKEDKTNQEYNIYRDNYLLIKFWDLESIRGKENYSIRSYRNVNYTGLPNFDLTSYYCNSSYNLTGGIAPNDDDANCIFANSFDTTDLDNIYYSSRNSSYSMSYYGVNDSKFGGLIATGIFYVFYRSLTPAAKSYDFRYANGTSGTNVSFKDSKVAWTSTDGGETWTQAEFTTDAWFSAISSNNGDQFQLGVYVEDTAGNNYTNFTFHTDDISDVNYPISSPNIEHYHKGIAEQCSDPYPDHDLNGSYSGNMTGHINMANDPDAAGTVNHTLYLCNTDGSINYTINNSFYSVDDSDVHVFFDTTLVPDGIYKMNITAAADDKETDIQSLLTTNNFTIDNTYPAINSTDPTTEEGNYSKDAIWANVTASDDNLDKIFIYLYNSTGLFNSTNSSTSPLYINFTNLPDGIYYLNASANDSAGNTNQTETRTIILDNSAPILSVASPENNS